MKFKHPVFKSNEGCLAKWYTVINGDFYYWGVLSKRWNLSVNEPGQNERELQAAMREGRVYMLTLKGEIEYNPK